MKVANFFYLGGAVTISNGLPYLISLIVSAIASPEIFGEFAYFLNLIVVCSTLIGFVGHAYIANNYFRVPLEERHKLLFQAVLYLHVNLLILLLLLVICSLLIESHYAIYCFAILAASGLYIFRATSVYLQMQQNPSKLFKFSACFGGFFLLFISVLWLLEKSIYMALTASYMIAGFLVFGLVVYEIKNTTSIGILTCKSIFRSIHYYLKHGYFKHIKHYLLIYLYVVLMILFPFLDKALVRANFSEVELAGYYFSFTFSMIYLLFSELLMKAVMPKLMEHYSNESYRESKGGLTSLRVQYSSAMFFGMLVFLLFYTLVLGWFPQYEFTKAFFYMIAMAQFILTQIKYDNVYFVAFRRGSILLYSSLVPFILYCLGLLYLSVDSLVQLASFYLMATALWWLILLLAKIFFPKVFKNETISP